MFRAERLEPITYLQLRAANSSTCTPTTRARLPNRRWLLPHHCSLKSQPKLEIKLGSPGAYESRESGVPIIIVSEEHWATLLR